MESALILADVKCGYPENGSFTKKVEFAKLRSGLDSTHFVIGITVVVWTGANQCEPLKDTTRGNRTRVRTIKNTLHRVVILILGSDKVLRAIAAEY